MEKTFIQNFQRLYRFQIFSSLSDCISNDESRFLVQKVCYHIHGDVSPNTLKYKLKEMITITPCLHSTFTECYVLGSGGQRRCDDE